jgi:hypothetical protein
METKVILPAKYPTVDGPIIFLAGPIQGADRWQDKAIEIIHKKDPNINIACPRRPAWAPGEGDWMKDRTIREQTEWETHFLNKASENGTILFWLANEYEHLCHRGYGQATRFELGEWKAKHEQKNINLVVGFDDKFPGKNYIKQRLNDDCPNIITPNSLKETCHEAIRLARRQNI